MDTASDKLSTAILRSGIFAIETALNYRLQYYIKFVTLYFVNYLLPFTVYTARNGYEWISGLDAGLMRLEQLRRAVGKLPEFDFGDPLSCGAVSFDDKVVVYRFMRERQGDCRGRDSLYLALTYFDRSVAASINFRELLDLEVFRSPMREPPSFLEYSGGSSADYGIAPENAGPELEMDAVGALYARLDGGSLKVVQVAGAQRCAVKYLPLVAEPESFEPCDVTAEDPGFRRENVSRLVLREPRWRLIGLAALLFVVILFGCFVLWQRTIAAGAEQIPGVKNSEPVTALTEEGSANNE